MAMHTPGPWAYQEKSDAYTHIVRADGRFLLQLAQDDSGEAEANARLIAALPDLLKVAEQCATGYVDSGAFARVVLAKLRGVAP